ncbi:MAG: hypothetical protein HN348_28340, partial [Proteobacteria bacterium]|nr:hypothetical protein [Pseudomonadota bacterium]
PSLTTTDNQLAIWMDPQRASRLDLEGRSACTYLELIAAERDWSVAPEEIPTKADLESSPVALHETAWRERADFFCTEATKVLNKHEGLVGPKKHLRKLCSNLRIIDDTDWQAAQDEAELDVPHFARAIETAQQLDVEMIVEYGEVVNKSEEQHQIALTRHDQNHAAWVEKEEAREIANQKHRRGAVIGAVLACFILVIGLFVFRARK